MSTTLDPAQPGGQAAQPRADAGSEWPADDDVLRLRPGVELLTGADGKPMLFDAETGKYVFLSKGALSLAPQFTAGATYGELREGLSRRSGAAGSVVDTALRPLLGDLRRMELLDGVEPDAAGAMTRIARSQITMPHLRLTLSTARADRLFAAVAGLFRGRAGGIALGAVGLLGLLGFLAAVVTVFAFPQVPDVSAFWLLYLVFIPQTVLHEAAHGVLCRYYDVPPREVGVALWFYIMPIAFVDRADSVRLRGRWPRVAILLAGPAVDGIVIGVVLTLLLTGAGQPGVLYMLLVFQTVMFCMNFNPMLPTDGQQALENALGVLNLRGRAMTYVLHRVLRRPLPSSFQQVARRTRALFWAYGTACLAYMLLMIGLLGYSLYTLATLLF